ncbi:MAG: alanine--tRNA ligase [Spirochaeta sp. LUC14_002_19_P3]|nr:MAG: alanine--tRNA ligase [Spirochaeta sp. LUC14_002_19_P3]
MTANEFRQMYIDFFISKQHVEISGKSLIPDNDPTVLFTTAGMHPLVPYLLGQDHPAGKRLVDVQKCIRTGDIEEVGDASHLTFFEMLGNWSLRDYFKKEAIAWSYEFLTSPQYLGLEHDRLSVTIFAGDEDAPYDQESYDIWRSLNIPHERIYPLPKEDNWWGPAGKTGPCGPDSEMFYDTGLEPCGADCRPGCSCGKYFEVWNDVFMQYNKQADGTYELLPKPCVDTGMGVERTLTMLLGLKNVYETELFTPIINSIAAISGRDYAESESVTASFRVIADHIKTSVMILGDDYGVKPSNIGQGYILRRLIRRAVRHGLKLGIEENFLSTVAEAVLKIYRGVYNELTERRDTIISELTLEETQFRRTLEHGHREFDKVLPNLLRNPRKIIPGRVAFHLYDTFGFPVELTEELASEHGLTVDKDGFENEFKKHQETSKKGADKVFKGGLQDNSVMSTRYHTATHLLHEALRRVLGDHVAQKGSNITPERLRFDFVHNQPMTDEEKKAVEEMVNKKIAENLQISMDTMTLQQARDLNARALFEGKYDEQVKVYRIGDFSTEVCGGPHVKAAGELGVFKIMKEQSISRGVRRIRGVLMEGG